MHLHLAHKTQFGPQTLHHDSYLGSPIQVKHLVSVVSGHFLLLWIFKLWMQMFMNCKHGKWTSIYHITPKQQQQKCFTLLSWIHFIPFIPKCLTFRWGGGGGELENLRKMDVYLTIVWSADDTDPLQRTSLYPTMNDYTDLGCHVTKTAFHISLCHIKHH